MNHVKKISFVLLVVVYTVAGINHFVHPEFYKRIIPPYLPAPLFLVYASGVMEIILALLLLFKTTHGYAAWAIALMLVAFLPVHVYMLQQAYQQPHYSITPTMAWLRLALQPLLILWALWHVKLNT